ncbi:MAG: hypothetical protein ABIK44_03965 [candidate division WOR-3 bacterium]
MLRLFHSVEQFQPLPFGPEYELEGCSRNAAGLQRSPVRLKTGPLGGTTLTFEREILPHKADFALYHGPQLIGHYHFDREPRTGLETMWEIIFIPEYQGKGLASLIVRLALRELLLTGNRHWVDMRKLMQVNLSHSPSSGLKGATDIQAELARRHSTVCAPTGVPDMSLPVSRPSAKIHLRNIGIGVIAVKLGFVPKPEFGRAFTSVKSVQLIEPTASTPPGYLLHLDSLPGIVVALYVNPETCRPVTDVEAYRRFLNPGEIYRKALVGEALIGNIDYTLGKANISRFARHIADNQHEFTQIIRHLQKGASD